HLMYAVLDRYILFFFSSRRRHTRCYRDWSSDVCSSDLLEHVKRFFAADLPNHNAVRAHTQAVDNELPLAHGTFALNIRRAGFEAYNVLLFHQKFSRVFDGNDSLRIWDVAREHIEQRGFAGAGATRNQEIQAAFHHRRE